MPRILSSLLIVVALCSSLVLSAVPCGRCVGRGEVCISGRDQCVRDLVCRPSQSNAKICFPSVKDGEMCNQVGEFDPCETSFFCNKTGLNPSNVCDRDSSNLGSLNDGCKTNKWCATGLTCQNGLCKRDPALPTECSSNIHCTFSKYCDFVTDPLVPKCRDLPGEGANCIVGGQCVQATLCTTSNTSGVCKPFFSKAELEDCSNPYECKNGLICDCIRKPGCQAKCIKPTYFILGGPGAAWGEECNPADTGFNKGCQCNHATKTYMYLKEVSTTISEGLLPLYKSFIKCMVDGQCANSGAIGGPLSCARQKGCYQIFQDLSTQYQYPDASLRPTVCSAQGIATMFALIVMMLLL